MKRALILAGLLFFCGVAKSQTVLAVDFNRRNSSEVVDTFSGFQSFVISSNGGVAAIQTTPTTRAFGAFSVTVANSGTPGYDDRLRASPVNSGAFSESLLLRDFVFSRDASGNSGIDVTISNLTASTSYRFTVWSFDSSSATNRVSDWSVNGASVTNGYAFNGNIAPTSDLQYRFNFTATTTPEGTMTISARRNSASVGPTGAADLGVFLNAFRIEEDVVLAPVITISPASVSIFAGDNATFIAGNSGTPPFTYQWLKDETNLVPGATTSFLLISNVQISDVGLYSLVVSNSAGSVTSAPATLTVTAVTNFSQGLLAYWPLDNIVTLDGGLNGTLDSSLNFQTLLTTNMDASNIVSEPAPRRFSASFNGVDEFLARTNVFGDTLPASPNPAYSVALWVKGNFVGQSDRRVFSEGSDQSNNQLLTIGTDNRTDATQTNGVDIFIRNNDSSNPINHRHSSRPAFDGTWHHIAWVDNNGFAQLYIDGIQDTNNFNYARGILTPDITALGAVVRTNATAFFNGQIDDVVIFRRSLTSNEIAYVMTYGPFEQAASLIHISVVSSNVTLRFIDPTGKYQYQIEETAEFTTPVSSSVWTEVTNAMLTVNGNTVTADFPQPPGPQRFYRLRRL